MEKLYCGYNLVGNCTVYRNGADVELSFKRK